MLIQSFFDSNTATFTYIVADEKSRKCAIIDSVQDFDFFSGKTGFDTADAHLAWIEQEGYELEWILETHIHADHLTAASYIKEKTGARVGIGENVLQVLAKWIPFFDSGDDTPMDGRQFDVLFKDDESFALGNLQVKVIHTPGHTPSCASYLIEDDAVFTGDTIFMPHLGTARADFPGGSAETLYDSIQKILQLPVQTRIYCCHDYPAKGQTAAAQSTVEEQKQTNVMINDSISKTQYVAKRQKRDQGLPVPKLLLPSLQVNLRCGGLGAKDKKGNQFIKIPLNKL